MHVNWLPLGLLLIFLQRLKEIGPNPSSPKALGDLLMHWVSFTILDRTCPFFAFLAFLHSPLSWSSLAGDSNHADSPQACYDITRKLVDHLPRLKN